MDWNAILGGGGVAAVVLAAGGALFKFLLESTRKSIDEQLKRAAAEHQASLEASRLQIESLIERAEAQFRSSLELQVAIDTDLRRQRVEAYAKLWSLTAPLPEWPRNTGLTYEELGRMSERLRDWYFETGGIWLSTAARQSYSGVQESINLAVTESSEGPAQPVAGPTYDAIREHCSTLRSFLTQDLFSRRGAPELPGEPAVACVLPPVAT